MIRVSSLTDANLRSELSRFSLVLRTVRFSSFFPTFSEYWRHRGNKLSILESPEGMLVSRAGWIHPITVSEFFKLNEAVVHPGKIPRFRLIRILPREERDDLVKNAGSTSAARILLKQMSRSLYELRHSEVFEVTNSGLIKLKSAKKLTDSP